MCALWKKKCNSIAMANEAAAAWIKRKLPTESCVVVWKIQWKKKKLLHPPKKKSRSAKESKKKMRDLWNIWVWKKKNGKLCILGTCVWDNIDFQ